jgi:PAS domain S-box-containing protein
MIFENGLLKEASAVARNITDKLVAEEKLRKSEEKYRSIIEHMKLGVLEVDREKKITFAYDRFCQMTGYRAEELIGKNVSELLPEQYRATFHAMNVERLNGKPGVYETQLRKKTGEINWALVSGVPLYSQSQEVSGSIIVHLDITPQKKIESDLLQERIKAEESSKAKETFLANMSHEIRTPMNAIIGMSNLIADTAISAKQKSYLDAIRTSANNLLVIINDVLDFSKIESGKLVLETIGFRLETVISSLMQSISYKADEKGLAINSRLDLNISPVIIGDPVRLNQVLLNLVNNAIKFTSHGYVELQCNLISETALTQWIEFQVVDTGIGISAQKLHRIYDSFSQEDESITRRFGGTGLGLSISKQIVELMGGQIQVVSEKEKGSVFSFVVEFAKGKQEDIVQIREEKKNVSLAGVKVLLVEDHDINRFLAISMLHEWKVIVEVAENGSIAVDKVRSGNYDLILMDMQMPVMSGIEATRIIRNKLNSPIPIIALTANADKTDAKKGLKAGMNEYITKPFNPTDLFNKIAGQLHPDLIVKPAGITREGLKIQQAASIPAAGSEKLFDLSKIKNLYAQDRQFLNNLIAIFKDNTPLILAQINEHFTHNRLYNVAQLAHRLKPSIDFMGITTLTADIRLLEKCQQKNATDLQVTIQKLNEVLASVLQQLESEAV